MLRTRRRNPNKAELHRRENLSAEAGVGANDFTDLFQVDGGTAEERVEIQDVGRESGKILAENGSKAFSCGVPLLQAEN